MGTTTGDTRVSEVFAELMRRGREGDQEALNRLYEIIYAELHRIADHLMRHQPAGQTLQASDLVGEAYLRMGADTCEDRSHFFALAARAMRSSLVDYVRRKRSERRTPPGQRVPLEDLAQEFEIRSGGLLELDRALERLAKLDERYVRLVELRFFAGLPEEKVAELMGVKLRTLQRDWQFARGWLSNDIRRDLS